MKEKYLPIGTVVLLKGATKRLMITGYCSLVDTNSTNHTYVNGGMIQSNVETKLSHGTKIRLANEDFEFRLY